MSDSSGALAHVPSTSVSSRVVLVVIVLGEVPVLLVLAMH